MTGFGRADGEVDGVQWVWECRSVNGKSLDIRLRLPAGFERLEKQIRTRIATTLRRGNVQLSLAIEREGGSSSLQINRSALSAVLESVNEIDRAQQTRPSSAAEILALRGVLETVDKKSDTGSSQGLDVALLEGFNEALSQMHEQRRVEGQALATFIKEQFDRIEHLVADISGNPSMSPDATRLRLREQLDRLGEDLGPIDPQRLAQEAALLATKSDIREELDRLQTHVDAGRTYLNEDSPVGRRLEFLAQEMNREANTLCAKSPTAEIAQQGLALKAIVDQLREQALNVE